MRSVFLLALGLISAYPSTVANAAGPKSVREECTRDRCVYYQGSRRVFSVEKEYGTNRLLVRDGKRNPVVKVEREDGHIKFEKARR